MRRRIGVKRRYGTHERIAGPTLARMMGSSLTLKFIELPLHLIHHLLQLLELYFELLYILRLLLRRWRRLSWLSRLSSDGPTPEGGCSKHRTKKDGLSSDSTGV